MALKLVNWGRNILFVCVFDQSRQILCIKLTKILIRAVSPEPSLLAHTSSESRGTFRQTARSLAPLNRWACAVEICHDGMLEDTNSLDGAQIMLSTLISYYGFIKLSVIHAITFRETIYIKCKITVTLNIQITY